MIAIIGDALMTYYPAVWSTARSRAAVAHSRPMLYNL